MRIQWLHCIEKLFTCRVFSPSAGVMVNGFIHMTCWVHTADRQIRVIRRMAFNSILRQHMGYFDKNKSGALVTSLTE